jgi:hypothetical protein
MIINLGDKKITTIEVGCEDTIYIDNEGNIIIKNILGDNITDIDKIKRVFKKL